MTHLPQLAFDFPRRPNYAGAAFLAAPSNAEALAWLDRTPDWPGHRLALWGEPGCGKTHLLHRWADATGAELRHGPALRGLPPHPDRPLGIDDADAMADEETLLHVLNAAAEAGLPVLLTSREAPARWLVHLPDLASRLRAVTAVRIGAPDENLLRILLGRLLAEHGLRVSPALQDHIRLRLPREAGVIREAAARLNTMQLSMRKPVSREMVDDCLKSLLDDGDEFLASRAREAAPMTPLLYPAALE